MKKKIRWDNIIALLLIIICFIGLCTSFYKIFIWKNDNDSINEQLENINEMVEIEEVVNNDNVEIIEEETVNAANPYWDYVNMSMIHVDFSELKANNSDVIGWIQVNGTNVNYPFVQTNDNKFYLKHSFDKSYNTGGWIFLDYRNNSNLEDKNNILYGHRRQNLTMFGSLKGIINNGWLNDTNNFVIKISNEKENSLWQVFSIYHIKTTSDYLKVNFDSDEDFLEFSDMLIERSLYNFNTKLTKDSKILTLSTCYNDEERMAIHAKLIKKESR